MSSQLCIYHSLVLFSYMLHQLYSAILSTPQPFFFVRMLTQFCSFLQPPGMFPLLHTSFILSYCQYYPYLLSAFINCTLSCVRPFALSCPCFTLVGLTHYEVLGNAMLFFLASYGMTATTLTYLMYNLALHPDCQQKAADEVATVLGDEVIFIPACLSFYYIICFLRNLSP